MNIKYRKVYKILSLMLCVACLCISLVACDDDNDGKSEGKAYIYYVDKKITKVVPKEYEFASENEDEQVEELLEQLRLNTDDVDITKAIPDNIEIQEYVLENGVLSISFDGDYASLEKSREVLLRAAVVLTMTQIDSVSQVSFLVAGIPLTLSTGEAIGNMQAADFANNLDGNKQVYNTGKFTIYYANQAGSKLVKYDFEAEYGSDMSQEQFIINKLIEGPGEEEGYSRTVPSNVQVVSVMTMDNICYVTFGENFLTEAATVPDDLVIYSIVNSLSEMSHIHKVQISVNGQTNAVYHGTISLEEPFTRNLDYVEKLEEASVAQ